MDLEQRLLSPFSKAKYLSEDNYRRYTSIISFLYQQHELYYAPPSLPSEIFHHIKENSPPSLFNDYTEELLESDLRQLEEWGNVISHADNGHVRRIQDYNRSRLRFQCDPETIEIERMLEKLSGQIHKIKGSLDSKMLGSLTSLILKFQKFPHDRTLSKEERAEVKELWTEIMEKFNTLREEASDYLGIIQSKNIDEAMQNKDIRVFREKFTQYLTEFIMSLHNNTFKIEYALKGIKANQTVKRAIEEMLIIQKERPDFEEALSDEEMRDIFEKQWSGIQKWFVHDEFGERYVGYLLKQTDETIRKFVKYLERLTERSQQVKSRRHEFLHLATLFEKEEDLEACYANFGALTNIESPLHFFSNRLTNINPNETLVSQGPEVKSLKEAKKTAERRRKQLAVVEPTLEDLIYLEEMKQKKQIEEEVLEDFTSKGSVALADLDEIPHFVLMAMLRWVSLANNHKHQSGKTETGVKYRLVKRSGELIRIRTPEGTITMDDYILQFEEQSI